MVVVPVPFVDFRGNDRLKPQSPRAHELGGVSMAACVGYGCVAVSEVSAAGRGRGGGRENNREFLSKMAAGDRPALAIRFLLVLTYIIQDTEIGTLEVVYRLLT